MNALILAAALIGQSCPGGSCVIRDPIVRSTVISQPDPAWQAHAVRVIVDHGDSRGYGSGTILGSNEAGKELVITARHVLGSSRKSVAIRYRGTTYPARCLAAADDGDLAAIEVDVPGTIRSLGIAEAAPSQAIMHGYGTTGQLHEHGGQRLANVRRTSDQGASNVYGFPAEDGDSGGGVFNRQGEFAGVVWGSDGGSAYVASTAQVHRFLGAQVRLTSSGRKRVWIFPFFFKCVTWNDGQSGGSVVVNPPVQPYQPPVLPTDPTQPGGGVSVQVGAQGPMGPQGPPGTSPDLTALTAQVNTLAANQKQIIANLTTLTTTVQGIQSQPGPAGPQGVSGPVGPIGPAGPPGSASTSPVVGTTVNLRFVTPAGTTPIRTFAPQIGPDGKPFVNIEIDTTQVGSTTIPVTPTPPTPGK